jgi:hypothetical protein
MNKKPISLHPQNPHYFMFRDKPAILITSGEHYGAVLNLDFDYVKYLDELQSNKLNLTRTFSGNLMEPQTIVSMQKNSLAPASGRLICPWARSSEPGYANGGNKFDLTKWDPAYFNRLKDFISEAGKRGIIVEFTLFCPTYGDERWNLSPFKSSNNINGIGDLPRTDVFTLKNKDMVALHEAMTRKVVAELTEFDNLIYEVCNEPYYDGVPKDWQDHIASVIAEAERDFSHKHLISQNIANGSLKVETPNPLVSVFNFHYATPPDAVGVNYGLNKVIGDNETGFKGQGDAPYRQEAWDFIIAGGGLYNNLDFSFTVGQEDGTFILPSTQGGGGSKSLRKQLKILKNFMDGFNFLMMSPNNRIISEWVDHFKVAVPSQPSVRVLAETGKAYAVYVKGGSKAEITMEIPDGKYTAEWLDTQTGKVCGTQKLTSKKGKVKIGSPKYSEDIALRIFRIGKK